MLIVCSLHTKMTDSGCTDFWSDLYFMSWKGKVFFKRSVEINKLARSSSMEIFLTLSWFLNWFELNSVNELSRIELKISFNHDLIELLIVLNCPSSIELSLKIVGKSFSWVELNWLLYSMNWIEFDTLLSWVAQLCRWAMKQFNDFHCHLCKDFHLFDRKVTQSVIVIDVILIPWNDFQQLKRLVLPNWYSYRFVQLTNSSCWTDVDKYQMKSFPLDNRTNDQSIDFDDEHK